MIKSYFQCCGGYDNMEFSEVVFGRRSVRNFVEKPVEKEKINQIVEAAIHAPSASNKQAWKFIIIDDERIKNVICEGNGSVVKAGSDIIAKAPIGIMVLYRNDVSKNYLQYKDTIQSAAAAIQNMQLMAYSLGIGACWICKLPLQKNLKKLLNIPKFYDVIAYVALGYPKADLDDHTIKHFGNDINEAIKRKRKYAIDNVVSYNLYKENNECKETYKNVKLACALQYLQLKIKKNDKKSIMSFLLKNILFMLGEKWA